MSLPKKRTVPMIAGKLPRYAGKALKAGDSFEASERDAKVLSVAKLATYGTRDQVRQRKPERKAAAATPDARPDETAALRARYEALAGKKPHNFLKGDKLKAAVAELEKAEDAHLHGDSISSTEGGKSDA